MNISIWLSSIVHDTNNADVRAEKSTRLMQRASKFNQNNFSSSRWRFKGLII